jgi:valyl-tRNA synthetase
MAMLLKSDEITVDPAFEPAGPMPSTLCSRGTIYMSMSGIDVGAEIERLTAEKAEMEQHLKRTRAMLGNEKFVRNAKPEVVEQARENEKKYADTVEKLGGMLAMMKG